MLKGADKYLPASPIFTSVNRTRSTALSFYAAHAFDSADQKQHTTAVWSFVADHLTVAVVLATFASTKNILATQTLHTVR